MPFPDDFRWGVATSAYQIEGGWNQDRKGPSIWDTFAHQGRMSESGDIACDHYHRWAEDVELLAELGVNAYRFSVAWPRVIPDGDGEVDPEGLGFYDHLVDALLEAGITPLVTLYHWDLPQSLQDRGGWPRRETAHAFARYADVVSSKLGDRVKDWITHNEPWVATFLGHVEGVFAPGIADWELGLACAHHLLVSHGEAVRAIRSRVPDARVGIALDCRPSRPATGSPQDIAADRHFDGFRNRWFFDPIFGKGYPDDTVEAYTQQGRIPSEGPEWLLDGDLEIISEPIDFLGLNYYTSVTVGAGDEERDDPEGPVTPDPPEGFTEMGWRSTPEALTVFLQRISVEWNPAEIVITENGASYSDGPDGDGRIRDDRRIEYLREHISAVESAVDAGVPVTGYMVWSFLDNLEWVQGFSQRFGLVWVNHETQRRMPKDSFFWYRDLIARNGPR